MKGYFDLQNEKFFDFLEDTFNQLFEMFRRSSRIKDKDGFVIR